MPATLASFVPLVHPHQMEVQDFSDYAHIIDARTAKKYAEDHIPGAINLPVDAGSMRRPDAATDKTAPTKRWANPEHSDALAADLLELDPRGAVLVYCDRGGLDSEILAKPLRRAGHTVEVLAGGWPNYRRWVDAGLELLPRVLTFRRLVGPPVCGLCRFLRVLRRRGEQVLDMPMIAGQILVPGLSVKGDCPPSQAALESSLLDALRQFDQRRPVWVRCGGHLPEGLRLPPALAQALESAAAVQIEVPVEERVRAWRRKLRAMRTPVTTVLAAFADGAKPANGATAVGAPMVAPSALPGDVLATLIHDHIDPLTARLPGVPAGEVVRLTSLDVGTVSAVVAGWLSVKKNASARARI